VSAIGTLLVANRGEIARRVFRTARAMGMRGVAVFADADAGAPFVAEADVAVRLPGGYLDAGAVVAAAVGAGADAVHPGYGFLAENADFARAVAAAGLVWVGPDPEAIETMGDKLAAKAAAAAAGVPVLPSSEDPADASEVGFPLMVKAAAGGGGKGMRLVSDPADLAEAVAAARREAFGGFGDDTVFLERYLPRCRHIEVQILGDTHGNVVHLGERECSIQRRHQKIIEESPSTAVDDGLRAAMGDAAVRLAASIGYCSAGTVELLVDDDTGEFFFLEANTRLQVEHPVTEEVTGIDLVREQLRVAAGESLGYTQADISFAGHAVEARLYAEDPAAGFLPAVGALAAFAPPADPAVRWDSGVEAGSEVGLDFDPMLAKVIAHAPTRAEAAGRLALALERLHLGGVTTNRHFLVAALRSGSFLAGDTTTDFIERVDPSRAAVLQVAECQQAAAAAAMWLQAVERRQAMTLGWMPSGWRHGRLPPERVELAVEVASGPVEVTVSYRPQRDGSFVVRAECADHEVEATATVAAESSEADRAEHASAAGLQATATVAAWSPERLDLEWAGRRTRYAVTVDGDQVHLTGAGETVTVTVLPRFGTPDHGLAAGGFTAPMPGVITEVRVESGEQVAAGSTLVVMEGMKMEHHVSAPCDGTVIEVLVNPGDQVDNGSPLLVFEAGEATVG
jgi:propionyl-CoA carboxylase alpha chain